MRSIKIKPITIAFLIAIVICRRADAQSKPSTIPKFTAASADGLLKAFGARVNTLNVRYRAEITAGGYPSSAYDVTALIDFSHGWLNSTSVQASAVRAVGPNIHVWVRNDKAEWLSLPEYAAEQKGTWRVQKSKPNDSINPETTYQCQAQLEHAMIPFRFTPDIAAQTPAGSDIHFVKQKNLENSRCEMTFEASVEGKKVGEGIYIFSFEDGIKWLGTESRIGGLFSFTNETRVCDNYKKVDGVWIPMHYEETHFETSGHMRQKIVINIESCAVNPQFKDDDFVYAPPFGSKVFDTATGDAYRQGYRNPTGPIGSEWPSTSPSDSKK